MHTGLYDIQGWMSAARKQILLSFLKNPSTLLKGALPSNEDELQVSYNSNHLFVKHGGTELVCRLIDARFPDYKVVIPTDNPYKLTVNKNDFQNALGG